MHKCQPSNYNVFEHGLLIQPGLLELNTNSAIIIVLSTSYVHYGNKIHRAQENSHEKTKQEFDCIEIYQGLVRYYANII